MDRGMMERCILVLQQDSPATFFAVVYGYQAFLKALKLFYIVASLAVRPNLPHCLQSLFSIEIGFNNAEDSVICFNFLICLLHGVYNVGSAGIQYKIQYKTRTATAATAAAPASHVHFLFPAADFCDN